MNADQGEKGKEQRPGTQGIPPLEKPLPPDDRLIKKPTPPVDRLIKEDRVTREPNI
jgi:hypothetical protein